MPRKICILQSSTLDLEENLYKNLPFFAKEAFSVEHRRYREKAEGWPYSLKAMEERLAVLSTALLDPTIDIILFARGGYGASDLLSKLPYNRLKKLKAKTIVGFSDITAILSALYTKLAWPCLHGPMPASSLWGQNGDDDLAALKSYLVSGKFELDLDLVPLKEMGQQKAIAGELIGGCLSVFCNLIGTPFFPKHKKEVILFIEDVGENPGRLVRYINQIGQSSWAKAIKAVIIGSLGLTSKEELSEMAVKKEIAARLTMPVFSSNAFGHISPNIPILFGAKGQIKRNAQASDAFFTLKSKGE